MTKLFKKRLLVAGLVISGAIGIATTLTDDFEIAKNLEIYSNIYRDLNIYYVDEVDPEKLMENGLSAMLKSMDPYTTYIPADEVDQFQSTITGHYAGLGAAVSIVDDYAVVTEVYENSPAQKVGLKAGDKLISADGKSLKSLSVKEVSQIMRGAVGSKVKLEYQRPNKTATVVEVERQEVKVNNLPYYDILPGDIGYIVLSAFTENAGKNVNSALIELKNRKKLKGIILDLRGNTGGLLIEAVNVVNVFVPKNVQVVSIKGKDKEKQQTYRTLNNPVDLELPLAVLIDESSASASEIVAGAIQDLDRGVIVGSKSFGKGLVQNTRDLPYGAKLKITTARYYIPSGRCIQALQYKDGKPLELPDSLREKFKTQNGRTVFDGGGITPDVAYKNEELKGILQALDQQRLIFDYAVNYLQSNTAAAPESFQLSEAQFDLFVQFINNKNFKQASQTEQSLQALEKKAKIEGFESALAPQIEEMKKSLKKDKSARLEKFRDEILFELQKTISQQAHLRRGALQNGVKLDPDIRISLDLLDSAEKYNKILGK